MRKRISLSVALLCAATTFSKADEFAGQFFVQTANHQVAAQPARNSLPPVARQKAAKRVDSASGTTLASWYGGGEKLARHTATGEVFRPNALTAAHRTLPLGTRLIVSTQGRSVEVRVNDRGPAKWTGRSLDLSKGAARALGMIGKGTARVSYHVASL